MRWYLTEQQNEYYRQCGDKAVLQINKYWWHTSIAYTWITHLGMVRRRGRRRREYITAGLCFFGRADERSAEFHCKGMHFKGEFKTNKVLSALTTNRTGEVGER